MSRPQSTLTDKASEKEAVSTVCLMRRACGLQEEVGELQPLFTVELLLEPQSLMFSPNLDDFQDGLSEVIRRFEEAVLSVHNLVPDQYFDAFTRCVGQQLRRVPCCVAETRGLCTIIHMTREREACKGSNMTSPASFCCCTSFLLASSYCCLRNYIFSPNVSGIFTSINLI